MALPPRFMDELRDRLALSDIIRGKVKLTQKGKEFTGLCPFHNEKTPSFTVNDEKGFYHCFGCGAHGDIIKFIMDSEKMPFMEAIEYLAGKAGLSMPKPSAAQVERDQKQVKLTEIMEVACQFYQDHLFGLGGTAAREYLMSRGISGHVAKAFRLGYAPCGSALTAHMQSNGYNLDDCVALGLILRNKERATTHDYFYDRIMFPILDRRKRVIGFSGRIMGKGEPKYLNSPETELFHKGETLYALPNAIDTMRKKNEAILVEGQMDVIALHSAGFTDAVAPMGTALTEHQLNLLWRYCDEPVICFDGDMAGRRASVRAINRALPNLTPGKSLRFVWLPEGFDADDMIRKKSPDAFQKTLSNSKPMTFALWNMLLEGRSTDTPERMAKLKKDALETVVQIKDGTVRSFYMKDIKNKIWKLQNEKGKSKKTLPFQSSAPILPPDPGIMQAKMLLAYLVTYPHISQKILEDISVLNFAQKSLDDALQELTSIILDLPEITPEEMQTKISDDVRILLSSELEMLKKSNRSEKQVMNELLEWIQGARIKAIKRDIAALTKEYLEQPEPQTWTKITELKKEIEYLSESE